MGPPMIRRRRQLWLTLGAGVLAGAGLAACGEGGEGGQTGAPMSPAPAIAGGEGGEGGEKGATQSLLEQATPATRRLARVLLMDGHLATAMAFAREGRFEDGLQHFAHPRAELFDDLAAEISPEDAARLEAALANLLTAAEAKPPLADLEAARAAVAEAQAPLVRDAGTSDMAAALVIVTRQAAHEYEEALQSGRIVNAAEYQDGWGFLEAARNHYAANRAAFDAVDAEAASELARALDRLAAVWPALDSGSRAFLTPGEVSARASAVEFAAAPFR